MQTETLNVTSHLGVIAQTNLQIITLNVGVWRFLCAQGEEFIGIGAIGSYHCVMFDFW